MGGEDRDWQKPVTTDPMGDARRLREYIIRQICNYSPNWKAIRDRIDEYLTTSDDIAPLIEAACKVTGAKREDIMRKCNKREPVLARDLIWYVMYHMNDVSLLRISRLFGKHHATIIASMKRSKKFEEIGDSIWLEAKSDFFNELDAIKDLQKWGEQMKPKLATGEYTTFKK